VAVVLVLAGCSDDGGDDGDDGGRSSTTTEEAAGDDTEPALGPCPYVTTEAVAEAFGVAVELVDGGDDGCDFMLGEADALLVGPDLPVSADDCDPATVVEAEPDGRACLAEAASAFVGEGDEAVELTVTGEVAAEESLDALVRLLPQVTPG